MRSNSSRKKANGFCNSDFLRWASLIALEPDSAHNRNSSGPCSFNTGIGFGPAGLPDGDRRTENAQENEPPSKGSLGRSFRQREPHLETCVTGFRVDLNISFVLLHNSLNRVKTEPCTFPDSLRRKKRFEEVRLIFGRDARTVIGDLNHNTTVVAIGSNSKLAFA